MQGINQPRGAADGVMIYAVKWCESYTRAFKHESACSVCVRVGV